MIIRNYEKKRIIDYLKKINVGKILFIFRHGLGDIINFIPIVQELSNRFPNLVFNIGIEKKRNLKFIYSGIFEYIPEQIILLKRQFTHFFIINYFEPQENDNFSKPYLCNEKEIGLKNFIWYPYKMNIHREESINRVGVHFFGNTNQKNKSLTDDQANILWDKIIESRKNPFEIHNPKYNIYTSFGKNFDKSPNTIRYNNPNIKEIIDEISKCDFFIGIDSGILYLAMSVLGVDRCIGIERNYNISKYAPIDLKMLRLETELWKEEELDKISLFIKEK